MDVALDRDLYMLLFALIYKFAGTVLALWLSKLCQDAPLDKL